METNCKNCRWKKKCKRKASKRRLEKEVEIANFKCECELYDDVVQAMVVCRYYCNE